jgi:hypothetical protein
MNPRTARLLTRLYPRPWRDRYGDEFEALLLNSPSDIRSSLNVVKSALCEHTFRIWRHKMDTNPSSFGTVVRHPTAFLPMAMSLMALALVLGHVALYGAAREADEGTAAHLWQLLMAGQFPILIIFAVRWLPRAPKQSLWVLAMQAGAALSAMAPVFYFNL